jgi:hypothetical protein
VSSAIVNPVTFLVELPSAWITIHVPGTPALPRLSTYVVYPTKKLPLAPSKVGEMTWLGQAASHPEDDMAQPCERASLDLSAQNVVARLGKAQPLPPDFVLFLDGKLRDKLRRATDCYFDLGDFALPVDGGRLLHLVSDSQWVFHWLLFIGDDGSSAVVGTNSPVGFTPDDPADLYRLDQPSYVRVADSFAEFAWRWWMDNEIFYRVRVERLDPSPDQRRYIDSYGAPSATW